MNINYNVENWGQLKTRGKLLPLKVLVGYKIFVDFGTNFHGCQFGQRDHLNALQYCPQQ